MLKSKFKKCLLVGMSALVAFSAVSAPAFAYVETAQGGGANTYTMFETAITNSDGSKTLQEASATNRYNGIAAYTAADGSEYIYAMDGVGGSNSAKGIFAFKRTETTAEDGTVTVSYPSFSLNSNDYRINNPFNENTWSGSMKVIGDKLYTLYRTDSHKKPTVLEYNIGEDGSLSYINKNYTVSENDNNIRSFDVSDGIVYIVSDTALYVYDIESEKGSTYKYSEIINNFPNTYYYATVAAKDGYIYLAGQSSDKKLHIYSLKNDASGLALKGEKVFETGDYVGVNDMIIINNALYVSISNSNNGVWAVDITDPEDFSNAYGKKATKDFNAQGMETDGRHLFVSDSNKGLTIYDALGGVDLLLVGGSATMKGQHIAVGQKGVYQLTGSAGTLLYAWDYSAVTSENIGYSFEGSVTNPNGGRWKRNQSNTTLNTNTVAWETNNSDPVGRYGYEINDEEELEMNYVIYSPVSCTKKLYLNARMRDTLGSVKVNGNTVKENLSGNTSVFDDYYLCDIKLNKGENNLKVVVKGGTANGTNGSADANIWLGGIGLSYEAADDENGISLSDTELSTGATEAKTFAWATTEGAKSAKVIYAAYNSDKMMVYFNSSDLSLSGEKASDLVRVKLEVPSNATSIKRFVFDGFESITPLAEVEEISLINNN